MTKPAFDPLKLNVFVGEVCPKCHGLLDALSQAKIPFNVLPVDGANWRNSGAITNRAYMEEMGWHELPVVVVGNHDSVLKS